MIGELIGAGTQILGGLLGNKAAKQSQRAAEAQAQKQYEQQKEFAQSGIQWKVQDAEKAGIHPLYALGANTVSYSPSSVGGGGTDFDFIGKAGQNIGRAIDATRSNPAKQDAIASTAARIQLEGLELDNEIKRAQLASSIATTNPFGRPNPGLPGSETRSEIDGQGNTDQHEPPAYHMLRQPQYTSNLKMFGKDIAPHPGWSDAQSFEDRYGEMSDYIAGPMIALHDYFYNTRNKPWLNPFVYPWLKR